MLTTRTPAATATRTWVDAQHFRAQDATAILHGLAGLSYGPSITQIVDRTLNVRTPEQSQYCVVRHPYFKAGETRENMTAQELSIHGIIPEQERSSLEVYRDFDFHVKEMAPNCYRVACVAWSPAETSSHPHIKMGHPYSLSGEMLDFYGIDLTTGLSPQYSDSLFYIQPSDRQCDTFKVITQELFKNTSANCSDKGGDREEQYGPEERVLPEKHVLGTKIGFKECLWDVVRVARMTPEHTYSLQEHELALHGLKPESTTSSLSIYQGYDFTITSTGQNQFQAVCQHLLPGKMQPLVAYTLSKNRLLQEGIDIETGRSPHYPDYVFSIQPKAVDTSQHLDDKLCLIQATTTEDPDFGPDYLEVSVHERQSREAWLSQQRHLVQDIEWYTVTCYLKLQPHETRIMSQQELAAHGLRLSHLYSLHSSYQEYHFTITPQAAEAAESLYQVRCAPWLPGKLPLLHTQQLTTAQLRNERIDIYSTTTSYDEASLCHIEHTSSPNVFLVTRFQAFQAGEERQVTAYELTLHRIDIQTQASSHPYYHDVCFWLELLPASDTSTTRMYHVTCLEKVQPLAKRVRHLPSSSTHTPSSPPETAASTSFLGTLVKKVVGVFKGSGARSSSARTS